MGKTADELKAEVASQRADLSRDLEAVGDRLSPRRMAQRRTAAVRLRVRRTREAVMGVADDASGMATSMGDRAGALQASVGDAMSSAADSVSELPGRVADRTEGNPLAAGLIAFGTGLLAASLLPGSRTEQQAAQNVQPALEQAAAHVGDAAQDTVEAIKPHAQQAVEDVKSTGQEAVEHVRDSTTEAAKQTADATQAAGRRLQESPPQQSTPF